MGSMEDSPIPPKAHIFKSLAKVCANTNNGSAYTSRGYWKLRIEGDDKHCYGKVEKSTVDGIRVGIINNILEGWSLDNEKKEITVLGNTKGDRSQVFRNTWIFFKPQATIDKYATLLAYRDEDEVVFGPDGEEVFRCERSMSVMFGLPGYGMLAVMYYIDDNGEYQFAIGLRNSSKATYPSMWDVVTGGCVSVNPKDGTPSTAIETLMKEGMEEARLEEKLIEKHMKLSGVISYTTVRDHKAVRNQETWDYYVHDDVMTIFELKVDGPIPLEPNDGEVQYFKWVSATQLINGLLQGDFKPNCALAICHVLLKRGLLRHLSWYHRFAIAELVFTKPEFPLSKDVQNSLATLGFTTIDAQREAALHTNLPQLMLWLSYFLPLWFLSKLMQLCG